LPFTLLPFPFVPVSGEDDVSAREVLDVDVFGGARVIPIEIGGDGVKRHRDEIVKRDRRT
jgi:hypothetical protein